MIQVRVHLHKRLNVNQLKKDLILFSFESEGSSQYIRRCDNLYMKSFSQLLAC